jgi:hypothetical protein
MPMSGHATTWDGDDSFKDIFDDAHVDIRPKADR